jgi:prepilin-type N-terminal cleavage/methylation domain-containing protein
MTNLRMTDLRTNDLRMNAQHIPGRPGWRRQLGTSLLELMIALAAFSIVAGAAFTLFQKQQNASSSVQGQVGLSLALRNATSQLELDLANAGNGYYPNANIPSWPVGVTIVNNWVAPGSGTSGDGCYNKTTNSYTSTCFDQVNIITADPALYPALTFTDTTGAPAPATCPGTYNGSPGAATTIYALPASGFTSAQTAAKYFSGDQLLFMSNSGKVISTAVMSGNATAYSTSVVALPIYQTNSDGSNSLTNDPLDITACDNTQPCPPPPPVTVPATPPTDVFGTSFCPGGYIIKLSPIVYSVQANSDPNNPWQLVRTQNHNSNVVMDQIIGFKAGAATWDSDITSGYSTPYYNYQASTYTIGSTAAAWNYSLIRSVRVSIIARTAPNNSAAYTFRNSFDNGPYQVQGMAIVVNPRNLSMSDDQSLP